MASPNSLSISAIFYDRPPDWAEGITLTAAHKTDIFTGHTSQEQRKRRRALPKYRIQFVENGISRADAYQRTIRAAAEVKGTVWVPFWCEVLKVAQAFVSNSGQVDLKPREGFAQPGHWALTMDAAGQTQWRVITAISGTTMTFQATGGYTLPLAVGDRIFPARLCRRVQGNDPIQTHAIRSSSETLIFETIA